MMSSELCQWTKANCPLQRIMFAGERWDKLYVRHSKAGYSLSVAG